MNTKNLTLRVRYYETDQMQYVHHSNYAKYFETARVDWLRKAGISYKKMEEQGVILPVISLNTTFKKPARYDDFLTIKTAIKQVPSTRIIFTYEVFNEKGDLLALGETSLVFVDKQKNKPIKCPQHILDMILSQND